MLFTRTWAAVLAAFAVVSAAILIVLSRDPAWAVIPGFVAIVCISFLYMRAAHENKGQANPEKTAEFITAVLNGEKPDLSSVDPALKGALADLSERIDGLSEEISELSPSDELTSLAKENVFNNVLWREFNRAERYKEPLSLVLLEVEQFEETVEKRGEKEGDRLLKHVASIILQMVRETDLAARYGQERFAVIMPATAQKGALEFAQRLRKAVEEGRIDMNGGSMALSIAIGAASVPGEGIKTAPDLVEKAAASLDAAKSAGRAGGV